MKQGTTKWSKVSNDANIKVEQLQIACDIAISGNAQHHTVAEAKKKDQP
jgi:hypothetical protein